MSLFKKKKVVISERDPTYKVQYLGNVQTALTKGDGCVDKPASVLWNNYVKNGRTGVPMKLIVGATGLKVITKEQGLTEYRAHKVSYCIAHPEYPKMFVWVYRHEGKRLKVELRCHAVLAKNDAQAKVIAVQLHDRLSLALADFLRMKTRRQNARLALQRTYSLPSSGAKLLPGDLQSPGSGMSGIPARSMYLTQGQNFKPSIDKSPSAPKLGAITEAIEEEERNTVLEEEDFEFEIGNDVCALKEDLMVQQQLSKDHNGEQDSLGDDDSTSASTDSDPKLEMVAACATDSVAVDHDAMDHADHYPISTHPDVCDE